MRARVWGCAAALVAVVVAGLGVTAFLAWPSVHLGTPGDALARVVAPRLAGTVTGAELRTADGTKIPVRLRDGRILPLVKLGSGERLTIMLSVKRPDWASWLVGGTDHRRFTVETPTAHLLGRWLQVAAGRPVMVGFDTPVGPGLDCQSPPAHACAAADERAGGPGRDGPARHRSSRRGSHCAQLGAPAASGESQLVPGTALSAAARAADPGSRDRPQARVHADVLGDRERGARRPAARASPPRFPAAGGWWTPTRSRSALADSASRSAPTCTSHCRAPSTSRDSPARRRQAPLAWHVPEGSTLRLQQLLAQLGYLPLDVEARDRRAGGVHGRRARRGAHAAAGHFRWRYANTPRELQRALAARESRTRSRAAP